MKLRNWFRSSRKSAPSIRQAALRARRQPLFESLEGRSLLAVAVFNVTTTADAGPGSLRQAIIDANASPNSGGADKIAFNIAGAGVHTISPQSELPAITDAVTMDATTQAGYSSSPLIELDGSSAGLGANGLTVSGEAGVDVEIDGLTINRFNGSGINVWPSSVPRGLVVSKCYLGTDATGSLSGYGNGNYGMLVDSTNGAHVFNNVISGNGKSGMALLRDTSTLIEGNFVGTNASGTSALGNGSDGIAVLSGSSNVTIGGVLPTSRNIISGNLGTVYDGENGGSGNGIYTGAVTNLTVLGNFIGTDATGTTAIGNVGNGVMFTFTSNATIGGTVSGAGNIISGNGGYGGIQIGVSSSIRVQGNYIGTDVTGQVAMPGQATGMILQNGANPDIVIGGTTTAARNIISGNTGAGIDIRSGETTVQGNWIGTDATGTMVLGNGTGIYLGDIATGSQIGGVTANASNLILQSSGYGISLNNAGVQNNTIQGNSISAGANGIGIGVQGGANNNLIGGSVANAGNHIQGALGLYFIASGAGNVIQGNSINALPNGYGIALLGSDHTVVGGIAPGEGNVIDGGYSGVVISGTADSVRGNVIINSGEPIGLGVSDGVDVNDPLDADTGFNDRQNHPVVLSSQYGATTRVAGVLDSSANGTFSVDLYATATANQLQRYLGTTTVTTDGQGHGTFDVTLGVTTSANESIIATATNSNGSTSEISQLTHVANYVSGVVANTNDFGPGSLRDAIIYSNAHAGKDTIAFNIPGLGVHTISPLTQLPTVTDPVIIDGYTQPGANPNTNGPGLGDNAVLQIELDGSLAGNAASGLFVTAGNTTIQGLAVNSFDYFGIVLTTQGNNILAGNFVGTDATGMVAKPNRDSGILLGSYSGSSNGNTIGGLTPASRNVISGNGQVNLHIEPSNGNLIVGNFVGTDATGAHALSGNAVRAGVFAFYCNNNTIGGSSPNARNIISGNNGHGVEVDGANGDLVQGNYIGTDVTGTVAVANADGVSIYSSTGGNTFGVIGNVISGNTTVGLGFSGGTAQGNLIGTDYSGTHSLGNGGSAVFMSGSTLGGTTASARNVVSGNGAGIFAIGDNNVIQGNYIGTDVTGAVAMGNGGGGAGVYIYSGQNVLLGGTTPGARNVIAANGARDVLIQSSTGVTVQGNYIGVDKSGNVPLSNPSSGSGINVTFGASTNILIGGTTSGAGNVIGGWYDGIAIEGSEVSGVVVQGNSIGVGADGHTPIPITNSGVRIDFGTHGNTIGGTVAGAGNVIANCGTGVVLSQYYLAPITTGNAILGNSIYNNAGIGDLGIDINRTDLGQGADGPNPNDPLDVDAGNNNLQNYPVLTNVLNGSTSTTIQGTLNSTPNSNFRIEFFSSTTVDPSGYGEGEYYLGFTNVTTDASGNASFNVTLASGSSAGKYITATATDSTNNTSEFSLAYQAPLNSPPTASAGGPYSVVRGGTVMLDASGSSDPDQANTSLVYSWDLDGDGVFGETGTSAARGNEVGMNPIYSAVGLNTSGARTVSLKVTDNGGLTSSISTGIVNVAITGLIDDPLAPGKKMLVLGGSTGDDTIRINVEDDHHDCHDDDAQYVTIRINEHDEARLKIRGTFALPVSRIVVYAQAGDDDVKMDDNSTIPAWIFGGDGDDRLKGGAGNDVLLGGAGSDLLSGSDGRDLMIGGTGSDRIIGNAGDDILIAGTTDFDASDLALSLIMKEWTRTDSTFATRVNRLKTGGGLNLTYVLTDVTVHDDHAEDTLTGCEGNDWFLFNQDGDGGVKDKVTDLATFEANYASDIDWLSH